MMIKQRKHNIKIDKLDNASIINAEESPTCVNKFRTGDIRPEDKASLLAQTTPKRSDASFSKSQDGSDSPDYRMSFPLTQDENIEVTWDWHSSVRKDGGESGKKPSEITTPKRAALKRRKRPPSSPLAYKPIRKQLIKQENTDGIDQFKAEMLALAKQVQSSHDNKNTKKNNSKLDGTIDVPSKIKIEVNDHEADTVVIMNNTEALHEVDQLVDENVDDLFNDSMDEVIIRFSQETEKKLNISPTNSTEKNNGVSTTNLIKQNSDKSLNYLSNLTKNRSSNGASVKEPNYNNSTNTKNRNQLQKFVLNVPKTANKYQYSNTTNSKLSETSKKQSIILNPDDVDLFIPDDSFDDFVVSCDTDMPKNEVRLSMAKSASVQSSSNNYQKSYISNVIKTSNEHLPKPVNTLPSTSTSSKPLNSVQKNSISNINTLIKNPLEKTTNTQHDVTPTRIWKFFKSKSRSDSNFNSNENQTGTNLKQNTNRAHNTSRTSSSSSLKSKSSSNVGLKSNSRIYGGKGVSNYDEPVQRAWTTSCLDSKVTKLSGTQKDNINMYNVNRFQAERGNGSSRSGNEEIQRQSSCIASGLQSMQLQCTPEEIERKRMEAKKKLEARKKRIQANHIVHSGSTSSSRQQIPVER